MLESAHITHFFSQTARTKGFLLLPHHQRAALRSEGLIGEIGFLIYVNLIPVGFLGIVIYLLANFMLQDGRKRQRSLDVTED